MRLELNKRQFPLMAEMPVHVDKDLCLRWLDECKEPWEDPSMGVFERITLQRKSEYVKGVKVDFTKPMEIADKSLEMNNIEMKKTNVQLIESVSPHFTRILFFV